MISQLTVRGFQSIGNDTLDLAPVTLITGRNYSGKSAILRALHALATNKNGDEFIKQGEKQALVSVTLDDGQAITWTKAKGKGGEYELDGRTFTKTAGQVPEEIAEALGIRPIPIDDTFSLFPQIQRQWDPPFLVGESGSRIARALGKLTKVDVIVTAQMSCRKKRDRHVKIRETEEETGARLTEQREALPPVEELRADLTLIHSALERAATLEENISSTRTLTAELRKAQRVMAVDLAPVRGEIEQAQVLLVTVRKGQEVKALQGRLTQARAQLADADRVLSVDLGPAKEVVAAAQDLLNRTEQERGLVTELSAVRKQLAGAGEGIIRAQASVTAARERHKAECLHIGICSVCPFVEVA